MKYTLDLRVEVVDLVPSPWDVAVIVARSLDPCGAFPGIVTVTRTFALTPAASGPTGVGVTVVQLFPPIPIVKVSVKLPVLVSANVYVMLVPGSPSRDWDAGASPTLRSRLTKVKLVDAVSPIAVASTLYEPGILFAIAMTLAVPPAIVAGLVTSDALAPLTGA